ncbi:MAG: PIN domain-containing protein [Methanobrevibacter sp.]|jgi:predicted nucleic acid-binding protein|nr:PIN domain-containing protein [Candidatus Methanoflexus mossambicus]
MIFLDTCFIVALANKSDGNHKNAQFLFKQIQTEDLVISNVIIIEVLNLLRKHKNGKLNKEVYMIMKDNFKIQDENLNLYDNALRIQLKYKGKLGFADCIILETMKRLNITKIASFDEHFDGKEGVIRIF